MIHLDALPSLNWYVREPMEHPPELFTSRLVALRRVAPTDGSSLYAIARNAEVMRFMDWPMPVDPRDTEMHLEEAFGNWEAGSEYQWIVLERSSGECVGSIACRPKGHAVDFGYFLGRNYWGRGMARDAASTLIAWLFTQPEILRIWATVDTENIRSRRLLERLGLQLEGVMRMATVRPNIGGSPRDTAIYAHTRAGS
jgi:RimJ/RimL family protein N-acetyltransferase